MDSGLVFITKKGFRTQKLSWDDFFKLYPSVDQSYNEVGNLEGSCQEFWHFLSFLDCLEAQFFEFRWSSSYVMIEPYYIYVDVFCTHLFLHTVKSKAAGDLALNFIFTVSVKCLPSQVCFNFLSELANGRSKIENRTSKF